MAVPVIPQVTNWTVTPQNGQAGYFTLMNTWLGQSTTVIQSLYDAIEVQNTANEEINNLAIEVQENTDITVSAKDEAVGALAILSAGAIDDTNIGLNKAFSNQYIQENYYDKDEVDSKVNINGFDDKPTPNNTDNIALQETSGLLKKLSFANLKNWIFSLFQPTLTGTATFTATNNKIVMTGIVTSLGLEVGDVIQFVSGTDVTNAKMRTVESITNDNEIVVNYEHCGSRGNGSLKLSDQSGVSCTVKRVTKYYNAPKGLGQDWVFFINTNFRQANAVFQNNTNRAIEVSLYVQDNGKKVELSKDSTNWNIIFITPTTAGVQIYSNFTVTKDTYYKAQAQSISTTNPWAELR